MGVCLKNIKCLVTDLDGTLIRLPVDWDYIREKVRLFLKTEHPLKPLIQSIDEIVHDEALIRAVFSIIEEYEVKAIKTIRREPELREFLVDLKNRGIRIALVTQQGTRPAKIALYKLGILDLFDLIITRDIIRRREDQLRKVLEITDIDASEVLFIGDAPWDYEAGTSLGCITIIVGSRVPNAPVRVDNFLELRKILWSTL